MCKNIHKKDKVTVAWRRLCNKLHNLYGRAQLLGSYDYSNEHLSSRNLGNLLTRWTTINICIKHCMMGLVWMCFCDRGSLYLKHGFSLFYRKTYYKVCWGKHQKHSMSCSPQWQTILNSA